MHIAVPHLHGYVVEGPAPSVTEQTAVVGSGFYNWLALVGFGWCRVVLAGVGWHWHWLAFALGLVSWLVSRGHAHIVHICHTAMAMHSGTFMKRMWQGGSKLWCQVSVCLSAYASSMKLCAVILWLNWVPVTWPLWLQEWNQNNAAPHVLPSSHPFQSMDSVS